MPTLRCNAACDYCFENKLAVDMRHDDLATIMETICDYANAIAAEYVEVNWQGGDILCLPPAWFERADTLIEQVARNAGVRVHHAGQTNLLGYDTSYRDIVFHFFGGVLGTSLDYPNLHRRAVGQPAEEYEAAWRDRADVARADGIELGVISLPNRQTLELGPAAFLDHMVNTLGITSFQLNTPFPGGPGKDAGQTLDALDLADFLIGLDILRRNQAPHVRIGPFDVLEAAFHHAEKCLPCLWRPNCLKEFVAIDPMGNVAQCDCWVTSYPESRFGNLLDTPDLAKLFISPFAARLAKRPASILAKEDCLTCKHLALCHGGCPVRTYTAMGTLERKDPYCELYYKLFDYAEQAEPGVGA